VFIDANYSRSTPYDGADYYYEANDLQLGFRWSPTTPDFHYGTNSTALTGAIAWTMVPTASGYRLEAALPWTSLGLAGAPAGGSSIGVEIQVGDDDNVGSGRDGKLAWADPIDVAWINAGAFGTSVLRVNAPPVVNNQGFSIAENSANGVAVGTVVASDPDPGPVLTYSITAGNTGGAFAINGATGEITVATSGALDFETNPSFSLTVLVTDQYGASDTATVTISLTNVNEAPVISSNGGGATASVNAAENQSAITDVNATDLDAGASLTYTISGGADAALFSIVPASGVLTFAAAPDFETPTDADLDGIYEVQVTVADGLGGTDVQLLSVTVTNVNEAPVASDDSYTVAEDTTLTVDWWDTDWTRRSQVSFNNTDVGGFAPAETLTDFPVLVVLNASNINYAFTQDDGGDLRFFDTNGTPSRMRSIAGTKPGTPTCGSRFRRSTSGAPIRSSCTTGTPARLTARMRATSGRGPDTGPSITSATPAL
jgi:hypothetical protein